MVPERHYSWCCRSNTNTAVLDHACGGSIMRAASPCRMQIFAASVLWPVHGIIQTWWSMTGNYVEDDQWEGKGFVLTAAPCSCLQTAWRRAGQRGKSNPNLIITWRWCPSWVINRLTMCYSVPELQGQVSKVSHLCCLLNMAFTYSLCLF